MVQEPVLKETETEQQENQCRHHWIIDPPHGATSWGQCKLCGARKEFPNSAGDALWERDPLPRSSRWGSRGPVEMTTRVADGEPAVSIGALGRDGEDEGF